MFTMKKFHQNFYWFFLGSIGVSFLVAYINAPYLAQVFYSVSLTVKGIILFLMPFIILGCSYLCVSRFKRKSLFLMLGLLLCISTSNFISTWIGYGFGVSFLKGISLSGAMDPSDELQPLWTLVFPKVFTNFWALGIGCLSAMVIEPLLGSKASHRIHAWVEHNTKWGLNYLILPIIPVMMCGFFIKILTQDNWTHLILQYWDIIKWIGLAYLVTLVVGIGVTTRFNLKHALAFTQELLPALWVGFSSMSSMAALPLNIKLAQSKAKHPDLVAGILPLSTNVHLVGDSIGIPMMALALGLGSFNSMPSPMTFLIFSFWFVLAKYSVAAIPGGGILVMLGVLGQYFGFDAHLSAQITFLYILLDPVITMTNVAGNQLFALNVDRLFDKAFRLNQKGYTKDKLFARR